MGKMKIKGAVFVSGRVFRRGDEAALQEHLDGMKDKAVREASEKHLVASGAVVGLGGDVPTMASATITRAQAGGRAKPAELTDADATLYARRERSAGYDEDDDDTLPEGVDRAVERVVDQSAVASAAVAARRAGRPPKGAKAAGSGDKSDPKALSRVVDEDQTGIEGLDELLEDAEGESGTAADAPKRSSTRRAKAK